MTANRLLTTSPSQISMTDDLVRIFQHAHWANHRLLDHLAEAGAVPQRVLHRLAHLLNAERIWLLRIEGVDTERMEIWPTLSLHECRALSAQNQARYTAYLESASPSELERVVVYRNQTGTRYQTRVSDILTHVAMHGGYHRGQIAVLLRDAGVEPVNTDFITFVREGR